ncbi:MAG: carboxyl-terminal processing protease [Candidatus Berkelbacteria bacterium Licking1014_2]|uniref:Carboxyl-terminal processing protease n=1 Tax=Candidatus Berkelbacteria bacterium Licking1014_2 TaxID=2017146 RepID=A0A554LSF0_9BACT|nr:MAG: carboxyl-terminal processing protease [Candidatus Berkelbacteria bacterium Licking1014_2]
MVSRKKAIISALIILAIVASFLAGFLNRYWLDYLTGKKIVVNNDNFSLLQEGWDLLSKKYDGRTDKQQMLYGALKGSVDSLGDPFTSFLAPEMVKRLKEDLGGSFEGIGCQITKSNNDLLVVTPLKGSPAEAAGLKPKDKILAIDQQSTEAMNLEEAIDKIRGAVGTEVTLTIQGKQGGVILDLRNNPGGYLDGAVEMVSLLTKADVVVWEKNNNGQKESLRTTKKPLLEKERLVVLVNNGSASAAEIVAGALQDYGRGKVVGETTFGKGSVQNMEALSDGSAIKMTIARWLTPKEREIDKIGIKPDIEIKDDPTTPVDEQVERAVGEF